MMEQVLWKKYGKSKCKGDREELIEYYLPLAKKIALSLYGVWKGSEIQVEDFIQYAMLGLIEAIDSYDLSVKVPFARYARFRIKGSVLNSISSYSENLNCGSYRRKVELERRNSIKKIIGECESDDFHRFYKLVASYAVTQILDDSFDVEEQGNVVDKSPYSQPVDYSIRAQLIELLDGLPKRNRTVLKLHYLKDMSFTEIADILGLSKASISIAHGNGISILRDIYRKSGTLDKTI